MIRRTDHSIKVLETNNSPFLIYHLRKKIIIKAEQNIRNYQKLNEQIDSNKDHQFNSNKKIHINDVEETNSDNEFNNEKTNNSNVKKSEEINLKNKSNSIKDVSIKKK